MKSIAYLLISMSLVGCALEPFDIQDEYDRILAESEQIRDSNCGHVNIEPLPLRLDRMQLVRGLEDRNVGTQSELICVMPPDWVMSWNVTESYVTGDTDIQFVIRPWDEEYYAMPIFVYTRNGYIDGMQY